MSRRKQLSDEKKAEKIQEFLNKFELVSPLEKLMLMHDCIDCQSEFSMRFSKSSATLKHTKQIGRAINKLENQIEDETKNQNPAKVAELNAQVGALTQKKDVDKDDYCIKLTCHACSISCSVPAFAPPLHVAGDSTDQVMLKGGCCYNCKKAHVDDSPVDLVGYMCDLCRVPLPMLCCRTCGQLSKCVYCEDQLCTKCFSAMKCGNCGIMMCETCFEAPKNFDDRSIESYFDGNGNDCDICEDLCEQWRDEFGEKEDGQDSEEYVEESDGGKEESDSESESEDDEDDDDEEVSVEEEEDEDSDADFSG